MSFLRPENGPVFDERDAAAEALQQNGCFRRGLGALAGTALGFFFGVPFAFLMALGDRAAGIDWGTVLQLMGLGALIGVLLPGVAVFFFEEIRDRVLNN